MVPQPEVKTEQTTDADRELMRTYPKKNLSRKLMLYLPVALIAIGALVMINTNDVRFDMDETKRGIWNVVLLLLGAFPLRLAISDLMNYNKDLSNFQVKIAKGKIRNVSGKTITIGNYDFSLRALTQTDLLQEGDDVELRAGYQTSTIFWLKKAS